MLLLLLLIVLFIFLDKKKKKNQKKIGGEIKTRFKYTEVEPLDFGLDAIEVLKFSDKDLNQVWFF